ncbi:MAG: phosphate transport system substrate-binding protein [Solirubrobacterales bacterium]|nr:phosphate transport system substrate-binding protein [Solirubrobacterales bacterium]
MIRNRLFGFLIAIAGTVGCMATISTAAASANLTGAGSSLVAPLMANWINGFEAAGHGNTKVTYGAVGSGAGIAQITARTVDFGASDAPLTPEQAGACNGCVQIPWALSATGIGFSIPGVKKLNLTGPILAGIYFGKITNWNDPKIKTLNPKAHLPSLAITPVYRSDGSGDTYAFTNYLSKVSKAWKQEVGYATSVGFTHGVGAKGNAGITNVVATTAGSIGYISASYLIAAGLPVAAIKNEAGNYEYPNLKNIENAAAMVKKVPSSNELHIVDPPKKFSDAYPISTFTYAIVPHTAPQKGLLSEFILYAMTVGKKYGPALDFAPLPKVVLTAAKSTLAGL